MRRAGAPLVYTTMDPRENAAAMTPHRPGDATPPPEVCMRTFHLLVANTLVASVTNNFLWFALTFWVYLETRSVLATAIIGGGYMLLVAVSGMFFGTFVDRHRARDVDAAVERALAGRVRARRRRAVLRRAARARCRDLGSPAFWALVVLVLAGAIAGNLRAVALSTTVTLLVRRTGATGRTASSARRTASAFAITSVFSGLAIGLLGMGWASSSRSCSPRSSPLHLLTIRIPEAGPAADEVAPVHRHPRRVAGGPRACPACWRCSCSPPSTTSWAACSCR